MIAMNIYRVILALKLTLLIGFASQAQSISVTDINDANQLANLLVGDNAGITIVNAVFTGADSSAGSFNGGTFGIESGILLTSGSVYNAVGPNLEAGSTTENNTPGDADLEELIEPFPTNDAASLQITFIPSGGVLHLNYVFASEEYNEFVCSTFNDPFGFFISGGAYSNQSIANIPGTDIPVSINNVNSGTVGSNGSAANCTAEQLGNSEYFVNNIGGQNTEYDGLTSVLPISIPVVPNTEYTIKLVVADASDTELDSGVFIESGSFTAQDCPQLEANYNDTCSTTNGLTGLVSDQCTCIEIISCPILDGNPGDDCTTDEGEEGTITDDCFCTVNLDNEDGCQEFSYYLADWNGEESDIYGIEILGGNAVMTWLKSLDYEVHIAYNTEEDLLYLVRKENGSFRSLDVSVTDGALSAETALEMEIPGITAAAFNNDNKLLIGSDFDNLIYAISASGMAAPFSSADVSGGDIVVRESGETVLATRSGGKLYTVLPGAIPNMEFGLGVSSVVTGLALTHNGDYLFSANGSNALMGRAADGSDNGLIYPYQLNEEQFTHKNGDLASACLDAPDDENTCENFRYFYANHGPGISGSDLYSIELSGTAAELSHILNVDYQTHIGYNPSANIVYLVNANGNFIEFYDVGAESVIGSVNIQGAIDQLYAVVYNSVEGLLYVGDANSDEIYTIDPGDGSINFFADAPVQGGDLVFQSGNLYLAKRNTNDLFTVVEDADGIADGVSDATLIGTLPDETNGMAAMNNATSFLCARFGTTTFTSISNLDGSEILEYTAYLDDVPFDLRHGDLASGCADDAIPFDECNYKLYYAHEGPGQNGYALWEVTLDSGDGAASYNELEANIGGAHIALAPDGSELYVVRHNGSNVRTYEFGTGFVNDQNIQTAGGQTLSGFPSAVCGDDGTLYAGDESSNQVYTIDPADGTASAFGPSTPLNGGDLIFAGGELWSIHRTNNKAYLVSDGGATSFDIPVNQMNGATVLDNDNLLVADGGSMMFRELDISDPNNVVIVNNYNTGVDLNNGDLAGRCTGPQDDGQEQENDDDDAIMANEISNNMSELSAFPNPSSGLSIVSFELPTTERATLELYNMNGQVVATIFNQMANADQEYRFDFNASGLPEGVYIYRLTTQNNVEISKFILSK